MTVMDRFITKDDIPAGSVSPSGILQSLARSRGVNRGMFRMIRYLK